MSSALSRESAVTHLRRFFGDKPVKEASIEEVFRNSGRASKPDHSNRHWLYNKMSAMRQYNFFEKKYTVRNRVQALEGLVLTDEGLKALGWKDAEAAAPVQTALVEAESSAETVRKVTFKTVQEDVLQLRQMFPELEIVYDVRLRHEEVQPAKQA